MNRLKKVSVVLVGGLILLGTTCLARTGTVNAPNGLVLRKVASKSGEPITTVSDNESVEILEQNGEWYKIKYGNYEGYMFAEYVDAEPEVTETPLTSTEQPVQEQTSTEQAVQTEQPEEKTESEIVYPKSVTTQSNLKVYVIPSVTAKVISNIEQSKTITINYELNDWVNITYENTQGWIRKYFINIENTSNTTTIETSNPEANSTTESKNPVLENNIAAETKKGYIDVTSSANIRETASTSANVVTTLTRNTEVIIIGEEGDFYKIQYKDITGYVSKSLVSNNVLTQEVTSRSSTTREVVSSSDNQTEQVSSSNKISNLTAGDKIVSYAKNFLGYSYVSGGTTPSGGFDCTGFTYYVYNECGYSLSRSCQVQAISGQAVDRDNLQPGDLLLFSNGANGSIGHVGIYVGGGSFIHAANSRRGVVTDTINSGYYNTYYYSARRIV